MDNLASDPGTEKTTRKTCTSSSEKTLQVCPCGWRNVTSTKGLKIHQGRKKCSKEGQQGPRIDSYFLRSQSSQSSEVQRPEPHQSSQDISPPEEGNSSTVAEAEECMEPIQPKPAIERKITGNKPQVKWPGASEKKQWETINRDLTSVLQSISGTVERKLDKMGDIIYSYGAERYGVRSKQAKQPALENKSRRQQEIDRLIRERRQLKKQWRKASDAEKEGINILQGDIRSRLTTLRRAENLRKSRKKKERSRSWFFKDPFKFVKTLFTKEKGGNLKTSRQELETYLETMYTDDQRHEQIAIPLDIPPIEEPEHQMDIKPPKWKEVEHAVKRARASSAPGPNGVLYRLYKNAPDVLRFLWKLMRVAWEKGIVPKAWRRAVGVLIPKEKESTDISQFRPISLLNVEGKIFFSVIAQRVSCYLGKNNLVDTSVQKAGIPGFSGCLEHTSMIWHQIQSAKKDKRDLHVVFLDLANAFGSVPHSFIWASFDFFRIPETITVFLYCQNTKPSTLNQMTSCLNTFSKTTPLLPQPQTQFTCRHCSQNPSPFSQNSKHILPC